MEERRELIEMDESREADRVGGEKDRAGEDSDDDDDDDEEIEVDVDVDDGDCGGLNWS